MGDKTVDVVNLQSTAIVYAIENLQGDDAVAFSAWFKALFDSSSEGIGDSILRCGLNGLKIIGEN